jgi:hypothetical protein
MAHRRRDLLATTEVPSRGLDILIALHELGLFQLSSGLAARLGDGPEQVMRTRMVGSSVQCEAASLDEPPPGDSLHIEVPGGAKPIRGFRPAWASERGQLRRNNSP